jgi:hypothetical protein
MPRQKPLFDLGVLFVHGIGEQDRGATLTDFGTPLAEWLASRAGLWNGEAKVVEAAITGDEQEPPLAEIHIRDGLGETDQRWLLAESWWAQSFHMPPFADLARWGFAVAPWTIGSHFGERLRNARNEPADGFIERLQKALKMIVRFLSLFGGMVMSIGVVIALVLLLWLSFIPWNRLRDSVKAIQLRISGWLGDSYLFVARPIEFAAIVAKVRRDLAWLSARCRIVAVVAHSQGAAVACHALSDVESKERAPQLLITFGSGLRKLEQQRYIRRYPQLIRGAALAVVGVLLAATSPLLVPRALYAFREAGIAGLDDLAMLLLWPAIGLGLLMGGVVDFVKHRDPETLTDIRRRIAARGVTWKDFVGSADPVPNGVLEPVEELPPQSIEIVNVGSLFADHNAYWRNRDVFVCRVGNELLEIAQTPIPGTPEPELAVLANFRRRRVRVMRIIWWATIAATFAFIVRRAAAWLAVLRWTGSTFPESVADWLGVRDAIFPANEAWGLTIGLLVAVIIGYGAVRGAWDDLNESEMKAAHASGGRRGIGVFIGAMAVHLTLLIVAVTSVWTPWTYPAGLIAAFGLAALAVPRRPKKKAELEDGPRPVTLNVVGLAVKAYPMVALAIAGVASVGSLYRGLGKRVAAWGLVSPAIRVMVVIALVFVAVLIIGFTLDGLIRFALWIKRKRKEPPAA